MTHSYCLVLCTCPDLSTAQKIAKLLVEKQQAACVSIIPGMTSIYSWQGAIETDQEHLLLIKTETVQFDMLKTQIIEHHPYQIPEIIALPIEQGSTDYLRWVSGCLSRPLC